MVEALISKYERVVNVYKQAGLLMKKVCFDMAENSVERGIDETVFVRMGPGVGFMLIAPNGEEFFLTDESVDALSDFQRDAYRAEGR